MYLGEACLSIGSRTAVMMAPKNVRDEVEKLIAVRDAMAAEQLAVAMKSAQEESDVE